MASTSQETTGDNRSLDTVSQQKTGRKASGRRTQQILITIGVIFLAIGLVCGVDGAMFTKGFSQESTTNVKADKSYYLLADEAALRAPQCAFFGADEKPVNGKVKTIEDLTSTDDKIKDVSLPFAESKGVYARVVFSENIQSAHISCNEGKNYVSRVSGLILNIMRWVTIVGIIAGIALLAASLLVSGKRHSTK